MKAKNKLKVLLVGQTPPPFHGQAISIQRILDGKYDRLEFFHVRMAFSRSIEEVGRFIPGKFLHLFKVIASVIFMRFRHDLRVLHYPPAGQNRVPMYRDLAILLATRWLFEKTVFFFHARGVSELYARLPPWTQCLFRRAYFRADLAITLSEQSLVDAHGLKAMKSVILPHGLADEYPRFMKARKRNDEMLKMLFVGILRESKGVLVLLEACRTLKASGLDFTVKLVGEFETEEFRQKVFCWVKEKGLQGCVDFPGVLTDEPKWASYADSHIFCFPTFGETFGLVVLEAMQFELPVVATPVGAIPSMVEEGRSGFIVPVDSSKALAEKLTLLVKSPDLREQMGKRGREIYVERYTVGRFRRDLEEAFLSIS